ncbi:MAG: hypothetical protein E6K80_02755 [Candidatus Eisenbacteria bacterium]|uniref:Peptidase M6-like domain-containing protein n=1 Tax=Eiseniibacteriota bacterium TaxID=2212470 RepID=A0A538U9P1_UNCEI|nr:MAG: hypothetical protein E6K80_02755 [Candidatus Eisenbacteria bacterium]
MPTPSRAGARAAVAERWAIEQKARIDHWRSIPHHLSSPAVDWSPRANRRVGWRASWPLRNPHEPDRPSEAAALARAAAAAVTPPDTIRLALLRVDFRNDRAGDQTTGNGHFDLSGPDTTLPPIDRAPHDSAFCAAHLEALKRYYEAQSYGRTVIVGDVWPRNKDGAYSISDMADLGPWKFSQEIYRAAVHMFRTMMFAADSQSIALNDRIPWGSYDRFMIVHAGSDFQSDLKGDSPLDIPSFTLGVSDTDVVIFPDSTNRDRPIDRAAIVPETASQDGYYGAINGVIAHENGHNCFGFADVYDIESGLPVVGLWSLMDSGNLAGSQIGLPNGDVIFATGLLPPSVDPFQRFFTTDALHFTEPGFGDTTLIRNDERFADIRRIYLTSDEYLLLENRAIAPADTVQLDQDSTSRVVLGPKSPDRFEYDALLPGPGLLIWHVDASVIPFETAFRINPDYGFNTNPARLGLSVVEADGLGDLGDPGSPYILGSSLDPWYRSNNPVLADSTIPPLATHIGTRPHMRIDVLDDPGPAMRFAARKTWLLNGWPVAADVPPGGPLLLAVDADGDRNLEVCWAGGAVGSPDSTALFAVRENGRGIDDSTAVFARLDRRPRPLMAALPTQDLFVPGQAQGPSYFAVSTYADGPDTSTAGGRVDLIDHRGVVLPGWPPALPAIVTTPPVIAGLYPNSTVYVGAMDGRVYAMDLNGNVRASTGAPLAGGVAGRLAVDPGPPGVAGRLVAAGGADGQIAVFVDASGQPLAPFGPWPRSLSTAGFDPEFLWLDFDGRGRPAGRAPTCPTGRTLIVHHANHLWAYCASGDPLAGWGDAGDTLVTGIGAGDPDGDGYAEVLAQTVHSGVGFWNQSGRPSPGWPRPGTRESFRTDSPPLGVDVDGNGHTDVVAMNGSGIVAAFDGSGRVPQGWPLATGAGAIGSPVAADLDRDGRLEIVAPDRFVPDSLRSEVSGRFGTIYAYTLPASSIAPGGSPSVVWSMSGGDPGRTATLGQAVSPVAGVASNGPYVQGSLKAYPNPAHHQPVSLAYQLTEAADVEIRILDASGHEVTRFSRAGRRADNVEVWDPGRAPAGLYLARVHFRGATSEHTETVLLGVLR